MSRPAISLILRAQSLLTDAANLHGDCDHSADIVTINGLLDALVESMESCEDEFCEDKS